MRLLTFSDLHLEFRPGAIRIDKLKGDILVLAGDIGVLDNKALLDDLFRQWRKPILYVLGNHEFYTRRSIYSEVFDLRKWLRKEHSHVHLLNDQAITIDGVQFFGGTMWTDFDRANPIAMIDAPQQISDFELIYDDGHAITPMQMIIRHDHFVLNLRAWFEQRLTGPRVVVSHHAPVIKPNTRFRTSQSRPLFNSLDMIPIIEEFQPDLWIYGHTHEFDDQRIGRTRVISNPLGYPAQKTDFDQTGKPIDL